MSNADESTSVPALHADILERIFKYLMYDDLVSVMKVCQLWRLVAARRMKKMKFTFEGLSPIEADASGRYSEFQWHGDKWLEKYQAMLSKRADYRDRLPLPPLLLDEEVMGEKVAFVMYIEQDRQSDLTLSGGFHFEVPQSVSPFNVELELGFTFSKKHKEGEYTAVDKKIIVTMEHGDTSYIPYHKITSWPTLMRLYNIYADKSSLPVVTKVALKKVSPEYKWFYKGLAPLECHPDGTVETIDLKHIQGTYDCSVEWEWNGSASVWVVGVWSPVCLFLH